MLCWLPSMMEESKRGNDDCRKHHQQRHNDEERPLPARDLLFRRGWDSGCTLALLSFELTEVAKIGVDCLFAHRKELGAMSG